MASAEEGYEDERFVAPVPQNLHCAICLNVLKNPMQCVKNEHSFCQPCITRHLQETQRCPTCIEPLTLQTLRPSRVIRELLSQLTIRCDNSGRGCLDTVKIEMLQNHVANCQFGPVRCSNDGCELILNRNDQAQHEMNECRFRKGKCEVCGKNVPYGKRALHCYVTKKEMNELRVEMSAMREEITNLSREVRRQMAETKTYMENVNRRLNDVERMVDENKKQTPNIKLQPQAEVHSVATTVRPLETNSRFSGAEVHSVATKGRRLEENSRFSGSVVIVGGNPELSPEMFNWSTRQWTLLQPMTSQRYCSSSFVYQQQMFVWGGQWSGDSMEVLKLTEENGRWKKCPSKLPELTWGHSSVVHEDNLFIFGGKSDVKVFNNIYKVCLVPPYSSKLVCDMPEPRSHHGAQCFGGRVFIAGGTRTGNYRGCLNSVLVFDIRTNSCQTISTLPYHVCKMATVTWKDNIVIIGGQNMKGESLNTVVMYNITNGQSRILPPMKHKRAACCAVMIGSNIVVMGGQNEEGKLNSVECFNVDRNSWEELPSMNEKRSGATAVVKQDL